MEVLFGFLLLVALAGITAGAMVGIHKLIGPKQAGGTHEAPFECGKETYGIVKGRFSVKFFVVALLFILFDVELIFLFPWAMVYRTLGWFGFGEMLVFLLVVLGGLWYSVKRGALEWN
jgi:NADH-quinone oxidoreductase subunit A